MFYCLNKRITLEIKHYLNRIKKNKNKWRSVKYNDL